MRQTPFRAARQRWHRRWLYDTMYCARGQMENLIKPPQSPSRFSNPQRLPDSI